MAVVVLMMGSGPGQAQVQTIESEDLDEPTPDLSTPSPAAVSQETGSEKSNELLDLERLAEESFAQEDLVTAVALYRQLVERHTDPQEKIRCMMIVAWLQHQNGAWGEALETLTKVLILDPDYTFRAELYSDDFAPIFYDAQKRALQTREAEASVLVREGSELLRAQRYDEARDKLSRAIQVWPDEVRGIYNLALVDYYEDQHSNALDGFQKVLALASAKPELVDDRLEALALTNLALLYMEQDQTSEASSALRRAVVLDPSNGAAWSNLGVASRRLGDSARATEAFQRAWTLDKGNISAGRSLALTYLDSGKPAAAADLLNEITARAPENPGLWLYLGMAKVALNDPSGAVHAFEAVIERDPENRGQWAGQAALQLASVFYSQSNFRGAEQQAQQVVSWLPQQVNGWVYLGLAQQSLDRLEAAKKSLETALRLDPTRADIHNSAGSIYFEMSQLENAERSFRRALEIDPQMEGAQRNLDAVLTVKRGEAVASRRTQGPAARGSRQNNSSRRQSSQKPSGSSAPSAQRPSLGIRFSEVDYGSLGLQGVMVEQVHQATAAARADIRPNDLLLKMDGQSISSAAALRSYAAGQPKGSLIVLDLLRDNRPVAVRLTVP